LGQQNFSHEKHFSSMPSPTINNDRSLSTVQFKNIGNVCENQRTVIVSISTSRTCCHTVLRLRGWAADWKLVWRLFGDGTQTSNYSFHVDDVRSAVLFYVGTHWILNMSDFLWNRELLFDFLIYFLLSKLK
jgi:hypothetical protein